MIAARKRHERMIARFGDRLALEAVRNVIGHEMADLLALLHDNDVERVAKRLLSDQCATRRRSVRNRKFWAERNAKRAAS